ncbi:hypothetical protein [Pectobacterium polaris]|uniref:hypothetical protein n=1 Tax=Pectobacterium polaris TaxID=2042057 RepID=UPI001CF3B539|nr:hypothetical protein [Pectobacterium polaris]MCA6954813.1 hypothetical protein [Pectobacterium polaris]
MLTPNEFMDNYGAIYSASKYVIENEDKFTQEEIERANRFIETASREIEDRGYSPSSLNVIETNLPVGLVPNDISYTSIDGETRYIVRGTRVLLMLKKLYPSSSLQ